MDVNAAGGSKAGASDEEIAAVPRYAESGLFDEAEQLAFELADVMTREVSVDVPDELFGRLQGFYSNDALVELAAVIALENFRSRLNRVFRVESNGLYCPMPAATVAADA